MLWLVALIFSILGGGREDAENAALQKTLLDGGGKWCQLVGAREPRAELFYVYLTCRGIPQKTQHTKQDTQPAAERQNPLAERNIAENRRGNRARVTPKGREKKQSVS